MNPWLVSTTVLLAAACRAVSYDPGAGHAHAPGLAEAAVTTSSSRASSPWLPPLAAPGAAPEEGWGFLVKPYLFASGLDGTVSSGSSVNDIEADFDDLLDVLDVGAMVSFEASPPGSRWKLLVDLIIVQLEDGGTVSGPAASSADVTVDQFIGELSAAYELRPEGRLEILGGVRYWSLGVDIDAALPGGPQSADTSVGWLDPLIGLRSRTKLGERFDLMLRADLGGFGAGSDFAYNLWAECGWSFSKSCQLVLGYRYLDVNYDDDITYDVAQSGPTLGLAIGF